jgi:hypothetical protein
MRRQGIILSLLACLLGSGAFLGLAVGTQPIMGPHDAVGDDIEVAEYWRPRHRAEIVRRGLSPRDLPRSEARAAHFRRARRVSGDILAPETTSPTAQAETQTEPYLAVNPEDPDHLIAGWQEHRYSDGGARAMGYAVSFDGGRKWNEGRIPGLTTVDGGEWDRASDPWPAFGPDGVAYFNSLLIDHDGIGGLNAIAVNRSEDGGRTWGPPIEVIRSTDDFNDKNSMVVDTSNSRHRGNVYVVWDINVAEGGSFAGQRLVVSRSTNNGSSYRAPQTIRESFTNIGIVARVDRRGRVYAIWSSAERRSDPNLSIMFSRSNNGGANWTPPRRIADLLGVGVDDYRSGVILPSLDIDPVDGTLYVAWADARFTGTDQAALIVSRDRGVTWTEPARVNVGKEGEVVLTVGVAARAGGGVMVGYYTDREDTDQLEYSTNLSTDYGASFGPNISASRRLFCGCSAATVSAARTRFLGDYVGLGSGGDRFFTLFTATIKKSKLHEGHQPDIFFARTR